MSSVFHIVPFIPGNHSGESFQRIDQIQAVLHIHLSAHVEEGVERNVVELAVGAAQVEGYGALCSLLVAQDQDIRSLVVLVVLDLLLHILVGVVSLKADAVRGELACDLLRIFIVLHTDGNNAHLIRGEPEGECALEVLDQDADEALEGAEKGPVDDDGDTLGTVAGGVGQFEVAGQLEVELDGAALPLAAQGILDLQVDLGTMPSRIFLREASAWFQSSMSPMKSSGRVESSAR